MDIAIFKTGRHVDNKGNVRDWTIADLDKAVTLYKPEFHEVPAVVGHPTPAAPAYGWVESLKRKGNLLFASFKQLDPGFVEAYKAGRYKKRSASFYADGSLRHVGFLGAMPPAVKGLPDAAFSEPADCEIEFAEPEMARMAALFQRLREFLIEKFGKEAADQVVNSFDVDALKKAGEEEAQAVEAAPAFTEPPQGDGMETKQLQDKLSEAEAKNACFSEKVNTLEEEVKQLRADKAAEARAARMKELSSFCEGLVQEGKLAPASVPVITGIMDMIAPVTEYEFSEGVKKSPLEEFKTVLKGLPKWLPLGEAATKPAAGAQQIEAEFAEADPERLELHKKISALAKEKNISYTAACAAVTKSGGN